MALRGKGQGYPQAHWCIGAALALPNPGGKPGSPLTQPRQSSSRDSRRGCATTAAPRHAAVCPSLGCPPRRSRALLLSSSLPLPVPAKQDGFHLPSRKQECCEVLLGAHKPAVIRYRASCASVATERPCCPCWSRSSWFSGFRWGHLGWVPTTQGWLGKHLSTVACKSFITKGPYPPRNTRPW